MRATVAFSYPERMATLTGMELIRSRFGLMAEISRALGMTKGGVTRWQIVPADRVVEVERITGIPREQLRPDLYVRAPRRKQAAE